ncbi:phage tail protein [Niameybacter sp.]|uniref:phage tail protein n=1 Tax=Niameybacter sp. TaxID=2033640 RepID=UPI002FC62A8F
MVLLSEQVFPIFKVVFEGLSSVVSGFWEFVSPIFNWFIVLLGDVVSFVLDLLLPQMVMAFKTIVSIIQDIVDPITQVFEGVIEMFKGVIDFVTGIFTGDWSKAWEGIKGIFSGVWNSLSGIVETVWKTITALFSKGGEIFSGVVDGIASAFKAIVNCLITGINQVISFPFNKINGLLNAIRSFDIPVIGAVFEGLWDENPLPVPNIPKLAQGGYVGANQPQLAMIGDNKRYGEIVAPENKMIDMIDTALRMQTNSGNVDGIDKVIALILQLIDAVKGMVLKVDIDMKKLSILLENAQKERDMIGG